MLYEESDIRKKIKLVINLAVWIIFSASFLLTGIVGIAQTSVPGDKTYPIKQGFEKTVLAGYSLFNLDSRYQIDLTELRFEETKKMIKTERAYLGFEKLFEQMSNAEYSIYAVKDSKKKSQLANQYIATLTDINYQLEQEKKLYTQPQVVSLPIQPAETNPITPVEENSQPADSLIVTSQISYTQEQIEELIDRLDTLTTTVEDTAEDVAPWRPTATPVPLPTSPIPTSIPTIYYIQMQPDFLTPADENDNQPTVTPTVVPTETLPTNTP